METYLRERGDANIRRYRDMAEKAKFWADSHFGVNRQRGMFGTDSAMTLALGNSLQDRFAIQTVGLAPFAQHKLNAVIYTSGNIPVPILSNHDEPARKAPPKEATAIKHSQN
jgi:hypothetical protein